MKDDLIRIPYKVQVPEGSERKAARVAGTLPGIEPLPEEEETKTKRTTFSIDPQLFYLFALVVGGEDSARATLKHWATEEEMATRASEAEGDGERTSVSRSIHKRTFRHIRGVLDASGMFKVNPLSLPSADAVAAPAGKAEVGVAG